MNVVNFWMKVKLIFLKFLIKLLHFLEREISNCTTQCKSKQKKSINQDNNIKDKKLHLEDSSISFMQHENNEKDKFDEEFLKIKSDVHNKEFNQDDDDNLSKKPQSIPNVKRDSEIKFIKIEEKNKSELKNFELIKSICNTKYFRGNLK